MDEEQTTKRVLNVKKPQPTNYDTDDRFLPNNSLDAHSIRTTTELAALLESDDKIDLEGSVLCAGKDAEGKPVLRRKAITRKEFLEFFRSNPKVSSKHLREAYVDYFASDAVSPTQIGDDFVPLMGGPFNKQLYIHDYLKMHWLSFNAYHHDPIANFIVQTIKDFTLGRGWRADVKCKDEKKQKAALALWHAFCDANDMYNLMSSFAIEYSIYGECMLWKLPNMQSRIVFDLQQSQTIPKGQIPRVRLIDPSCIWEIVTFPEDITRVLYYQWVAPTQFQIYTGSSQGAPVQSTKFIYQQIAGEDVLHYKYKSVSNEKRGRSELFCVLYYLKAMRDVISYGMAAMQKSAAWSIDTTITGSQEDIDQYIDDQDALGAIPPAGSEFVHTDKVKREYLSNTALSKGGTSDLFQWCLSMISIGTGIPVGYLGSHLSGGQTRASALVATEPVAKKFQMRQLVYERVLQDLSKWLFGMYGFDDCELEVTFPEVLVEDRSTKLKDLAMAELQGWISKETAANIAAKELGITEFDYIHEKQDIEEEQQSMDSAMMPPMNSSPLTTPPQAQPESKTAVTSKDKQEIKQRDGF
jgi:hypothetical protein